MGPYSNYHKVNYKAWGPQHKKDAEFLEQDDQRAGIGSEAGYNTCRYIPPSGWFFSTE